MGLTLEAALLQQFDFLEDITIAIDNQAATKVTTNHRSAPGHQLIDFFHNQMSELAKWHQGVPIKIHWIPSHKGILGNEEVDKLAKQAMKQQGNPPPMLPSIFVRVTLKLKETLLVTKEL